MTLSSNAVCSAAFCSNSELQEYAGTDWNSVILIRRYLDDSVAEAQVGSTEADTQGLLTVRGVVVSAAWAYSNKVLYYLINLAFSPDLTTLERRINCFFCYCGTGCPRDARMGRQPGVLGFVAGGAESIIGDQGLLGSVAVRSLEVLLL